MLQRLPASLIAAALLVMPAAALTPAQVEQCNAMAATFPAKQERIAAQTEARDALVARTEAAGEAWESAEELRNFSPDHAAAADTARAEWQALRAQTVSAERALQSAVQMLNTDAAQFNQRCTPQ